MARRRTRLYDIRISPAGEGFYAAASEANRTNAEQAESDCTFCLEGWVFLGSINHDGWEVFEAMRCPRCDGTGRIEDREAAGYPVRP
jgi:hypothetical protein